MFYVVLTNYAQKGFAWKLATGLIIFEFSINMMYMIFRMRETAAAHDPAVPNPLAPFMAAHGINRTDPTPARAPCTAIEPLGAAPNLAMRCFRPDLRRSGDAQQGHRHQQRQPHPAVNFQP